MPATPPGLPQPLYETRLSYLDQSHYYGSQYFFDLIRYRPDRPLRTIGDNYFETRLIREQIARAMGGHEYRNAVRGLALNGRRPGGACAAGIPDSRDADGRERHARG
ncbi:hypothetical protein, partial [Bordetella pertussis]|uniref:hypothetical protein n=1 Tax=Bordetella pertussis TaxID=520 RepID=UPI003879A213